MKGHPKYNIDDRVKFDIDGRVYHGNVYIIDPYGTWDDDSDVSYDIMADDWGDNHDQECLFKHFTEKFVAKVMLDRNKIDKNGFHFMIEDNNKIEIQKVITDSLYDMLGNWYWHEDEFVYVLGLSMDKYDYYYMVIDDKDYRIKFITCLYNLEKNPRPELNELSVTEEKIIKSYVNQYFLDHKNEKLLYFNI